MYNGFVKVSTVTPSIKLADCKYNAEQIINSMACAESAGIEIIAFPELSITGYSCQDLFFQRLLIEEAEAALLRIVDFSHNLPRLTSIVGMPIELNNQLYNCAVVIKKGKVCGIVPQTYVSHERGHLGKRWFTSATILPSDATFNFYGESIPIGNHLMFKHVNFNFAVEIGNDIFSTTPPSCQSAVEGADIIFNLGAHYEMAGKGEYLKSTVINQSARCICGYVYVSCGFGESTQDKVYGGRSYIAENGILLAEEFPFSMKANTLVCELDTERLRNERISNSLFGDSKINRDNRINKLIDLECTSIIDEHFSLTRKIDPLPFVPEGNELNLRCEEILCIQSEGLARRIEHTHAQTVIIGISGGLDSTLALLVCVHAFDRLNLNRKGIIGITMPGFGTTDRTYTNAINLMKSLGITIREISIKEACEIHFKDIGHDIHCHDTTYENSQARERTQILMDAANQTNGFVVGTGDLSELALGWATYNGDHMSMYAVNASIPKTLVKHLVEWIAHHLADEYSKPTLLDIVDTPISPELIPADESGHIKQKTEDLVGPYELHDFFLYYTLRHGFRPSKIYDLACKAFDGSNSRVCKYDDLTIKKWITIFFKRFFTQQFKRSCLPDGPKTGSCSLSPRGDWCMPTDAMPTLWLEECNQL